MNEQIKGGKGGGGVDAGLKRERTEKKKAAGMKSYE